VDTIVIEMVFSEATVFAPASLAALDGGYQTGRPTTGCLRYGGQPSPG
jgi:hypothetical protein